MAKSKARSTIASSRGNWILLALAVVLVVLGWYYYTPAQAYAQTAAAYSARVACSCRFVAGRSLEDCEKDKLEGMELVTLVEDAEAKSVTARFPLIADDTAFYREGYGCVLEKWED
ncbi:hypothetical protein [Altererythrobacter sp. BO-6]|uniref:hypothetical protein n=1 Tax=Altererythrobacter sp. BO-6 TaxID=2604537 RepID=UPI0019CFEF57|nr:hypothetical protein [Altererythrobacter sp. BO-6]